MSNMRIMWRNFFDDATLTTDGEVAGNNALANLQDAGRSVWRTLKQPNEVSIWGHWDGMRFPCSWLLINRHNFPAHATVRLRLWAAADWSGTALVDETVDVYETLGAPFTDGGEPLNGGTVLLPTVFTESGIDPFTQIVFSRVRAGSFLLTIAADTFDPKSYWQAQRVYLGSYATVPVNPSIGATGSWQSGTTQTRLRSGALASDQGYVNRKFSGKLIVQNDAGDSADFDGLNTFWNGAATVTTAVTYREELFRALRRVELSRDVLVSIFPDLDADLPGHLELHHTYAAKLSTMPDFAWQGPLRWELPFTLEET